jgi:hypothetical protein
MTEQWRPIVGHEGFYEVSDHGRVRTVEREVEVTLRGRAYRKKLRSRIMSPSRHWFGYPQVRLAVEGRPATGGAIYKFVAEAFIGPRPDGMVVRHRDGDPANCRADNLCYGTQQENMDDRAIHGTTLRGEQIATSKLTEEQIWQIKARLEAGDKQKTIASAFDIHESTVSAINTRRLWRHV